MKPLKAFFPLLFAAMLVSVALPAGAQRPWSLDSCISYAVSHNISVRNAELNALSGEYDVTEAKDRFLPELSGYASQNFNFGRGLTADNTYANRNTSSFSVGAQLSLPLFQGLSAVRQLGYSRTSLRALLEHTEAAKDDVTLNVISQYLQALYASEMLGVAREKLALSTAELERTRSLVDAGKLPELDLYQAESTVAQNELAVVNASNDSILALLDLTQLLNLPTAEGFAIEPLPDEPLQIMNPEDVYATALANNHAMRAYSLDVEAAEKSVGVAKSGYIPRLSFNAGLGTNYYRTSGYDNETFGEQMRHNFSKSIGFSLSVPIFDGFSTRNSVRKAQVRVTTARLQLDDRRQTLYKAIMTAYTQAIGAQKKKDAAAKSVDSSRAAFEAMREKYTYGKANATELEQAQTDYTTALADAVQAKYEALLRARILEFYNRN